MIIPKPQIAPNTRYMVFIAIVIFFNFGDDLENKIALYKFILFALMFGSLCLFWVTGIPHPNHSTVGQSEKGPCPVPRSVGG